MSTRQCCRRCFFDRPPYAARLLLGVALALSLGPVVPRGIVLLGGPDRRLGHALQLELEPGRPANPRSLRPHHPKPDDAPIVDATPQFSFPSILLPAPHLRPRPAATRRKIANGGTANVTTSGPVCGALSIGAAAGNGTLQVLSGSLAISGSAYVGDSGAGGLVQSGGVVSVADSAAMFVGYNNGSAGNYNLSGGLLAAGTQWIGYRGEASFTQTGGTNSAANQLVLGWDAPTPVSYTLSNTGLLSAGNEWVGMSGSTNFTQSGGTHSVAGFLFVNAANYGLSAGLLSVGADEYVGFGQSAVFNQSGGTHQVTSGGLNLGLNGTTGTYNLGGGLLVVSQLNPGSGQAVFNFNGGTLQAAGPLATSMPMTLGGSGATLDTAGNSVTLAAQLSGSGCLTEVGGGLLVLSNTNTYTGNTTVTSGTLRFPALANNGSDKVALTTGVGGGFGSMIVPRFRSAAHSAASAPRWRATCSARRPTSPPAST